MRLRDQEKVYNLRFQPHYTDNQVLSGVMMFFDEPQAEAKRIGVEIDCHRNFEILGSHVDEGFFVIDFDGTVTFVNEQACKLLQFEFDNLRYQPVDQIFPDAFSDGFISSIRDDKTYLNVWRDFT